MLCDVLQIMPSYFVTSFWSHCSSAMKHALVHTWDQQTPWPSVLHESMSSYEFLPNIIMFKVSVWIHTPNIETASTYMSDACRSWDTEPTNCSLPDTYSYIQNTGPVELVVVTRSRKCPDIVKDFPLILPWDGRVKLTTTFSSVLCFSFLLPCFSFPLYTLICVGDQ